MFKARAVVIAGIVVVPALAVAGLSRFGITLPKMFSRDAIRTAEVPITPPVGPQFAARVARPAGESESRDIVADVRMRDALSKILEGTKNETVQSATPLLAFTDEPEVQSIDHMRESLGLVLREESTLSRLSDDAAAAESEAEASNDSMMITDSQPLAGAFSSNPALAGALFPSAAVREMTGQGVQQGEQAPLVQRIASNPAPFQGNDGVASGRRPSETFNFDPGEMIANGETPAPGTIALGVLGLVGFLRRRA